MRIVDMEVIPRLWREMDPRGLEAARIGSWPVAIRYALIAMAFFAVLAGIWVLLLAKQLAELGTAAAREEALKGEFARKVVSAAPLEALQQRLAKLRPVLDRYLDLLPIAAEIPALIDSIGAHGRAAGLSFSAMELHLEHQARFHTALPFSLRLQGSYHDLAAFVSRVENLPHLVTFHDFSLNRIAGDQLELAAEAKIYRRLHLSGQSP